MTTVPITFALESSDAVHDVYLDGMNVSHDVSSAVLKLSPAESARLVLEFDCLDLTAGGETEIEHRCGLGPGVVEAYCREHNSLATRHNSECDVYYTRRIHTGVYGDEEPCDLVQVEYRLLEDGDE